MDYVGIGKRIRAQRLKLELSQEELAEKVFVTRQAVSRWETGETVPNTETLKLLSANTKLSLPVLVDIACALGVRTDDLIFDKDTMGKDELLEEIALELEGCTNAQLLALRQILSASKEAIDHYLD